MLFLADANVFVPMADGLRDMGHDVFDVKEKGLENLSDPDIFRLAQKERRILVTMDKDFSETRHRTANSFLQSIPMRYL